MLFNEKLILANGFNEAEFLRTLAKNDINTFGLRVFNDMELCSYILMKNGIKMNGSFISDKEQSFIYYSFLKGVLEDSKNIKDAINSFRDCVDSDVLVEMEKVLSDNFIDKKNLITKAFKEYKKYKEDHNLYDKHDMINYIIDNNLKVKDVFVEYFLEQNNSYILKKMINNVFTDAKEVSIFTFFKEHSNNTTLIKAYGKKNEIDYIFNKINQDNLKLDECQIVLMDAKDMPEVLVYLNKYNIPFTAKDGIPFIDTKPGKLLKALLDLRQSNYGVDGYKKLFNNEVFKTEFLKALFEKDGNNVDDRFKDFINNIGNLRLRFDEDVLVSNVYDDVMYNALNVFKNDLRGNILTFFYKYVNATMDEAIVALDKIEEVLNLKKKYNIELDDLSLLENLLPIGIGGVSSSESKIHISGLTSAFSSLRKYNFIVGLDDSYPGNPKENYLIYDDEFKKTKSDKYISTKVIENKEKLAKCFIKSCENAYLIYPYYDLLDLKDKNPSSIIYDEIIYDKNYNPTNIIEYGFKESSLTENINIIKSKINNEVAKEIKYSDYNDVEIDSTKLLDMQFSPSGIRSFFDNKLAFVFQTLFNISIDDTDDIYTVMPSKEKGNIIHKIMERFQKNKVNRDDFINKAKEEYDKYLLKRPAVLKSQIEIDKDRFITDVENMYDMDPSNTFVASEVLMMGSIGKIKFKGKFDRLEVTKDNKYIIVDYKTGNSMQHISNNVISCIQGLIYAYLVELNGIKGKKIKVSRVEFRYPHINQVAYIDYDEDNKLEMINAIKELEDAIIVSDFSCNKDLSEYSFIDKYKVLLSLFEEVCK